MCLAKASLLWLKIYFVSHALWRYHITGLLTSSLLENKQMWFHFNVYQTLGLLGPASCGLSSLWLSLIMAPSPLRDRVSQALEQAIISRETQLEKLTSPLSPWKKCPGSMENLGINLSRLSLMRDQRQMESFVSIVSFPFHHWAPVLLGQLGGHSALLDPELLVTSEKDHVLSTETHYVGWLHRHLKLV